MYKRQVQSIDADEGVFTSLGQQVLASSDMLAALQPGDFVDVYGTVVGSGVLYADSVSVSARPYVIGADTLLVVGVPTSVDIDGASASLGQLQVDFSSSSLVRNSGSGLMTFVGVQADESGFLFADIADRD